MGETLDTDGALDRPEERGWSSLQGLEPETVGRAAPSSPALALAA